MDRLRQAVNRLDRERARIHRLTGDVVLPNRGNAATRRVCSKACGWAVSAWEWKFELYASEGTVCPRCGADVVLVEA